MSTDDGGAARPDDPGAPARAYNRPRRYPVQVQAPAPAAEVDTAPTPPPVEEVTRQNPSLAAAAEDYARRQGTVPPSVGHGGGAGPGAPPPGAPPPSGYGPPPAGYPPAGDGSPPPAGARTSRRGLLVAAAAVVVLAVVVALIVVLSGDDNSRKHLRAGVPASTFTATPSTADPSTAAPSTAAPSAAPTSGTAAAPPADETPATEVCTNLGNTAPLTSFVAQPRPAERMPTSYVEPQTGEKVAVCVGLFRPGAGAGRGRIGYLAEYERLPATQYATALKTLGWTVVPGLPSPTYRDNGTTTVTLVQQGTSLVTVVGTGA